MKRRYKDIRNELMKNVGEKPKTISQIAKDSKTDWKTTRKYLKSLRDNDLVEEFFSSPHVRLFKKKWN